MDITGSKMQDEAYFGDSEGQPGATSHHVLTAKVYISYRFFC